MLPMDLSAAANAAVSEPPVDPDAGVQAVADWFRSIPDMETRFATSIRQAFDEVLDGQRTGRFDITAPTVEQPEKTYLGIKVEIIVRAAFDLPRGSKMDFRIADHEVDSKFTMGKNWTIPLEAFGHICLVMIGSDKDSTFRVGLIRVSDANLNPGRNRDKKRSLSKEGRRGITWLVLNGKLPENILLHLPDAALSRIFADSRSGQKRTNELFRCVQGRLINRSTVLTVGRQGDSPKRVRDARLDLRDEGILIFGHLRSHRRAAEGLGLPVPSTGEWVSARVTPAVAGISGRSAEIGGASYVIAEAGSPVTRAPLILR